MERIGDKERDRKKEREKQSNISINPTTTTTNICQISHHYTTLLLVIICIVFGLSFGLSFGFGFRVTNTMRRNLLTSTNSNIYTLTTPNNDPTLSFFRIANSITSIIYSNNYDYTSNSNANKNNNTIQSILLDRGVYSESLANYPYQYLPETSWKCNTNPNPRKPSNPNPNPSNISKHITSKCTVMYVMSSIGLGDGQSSYDLEYYSNPNPSTREMMIIVPEVSLSLTLLETGAERRLTDMTHISLPSEESESLRHEESESESRLLVGNVNNNYQETTYINSNTGHVKRVNFNDALVLSLPSPTTVQPSLTMKQGVENEAEGFYERHVEITLGLSFQGILYQNSSNTWSDYKNHDDGRSSVISLGEEYTSLTLQPNYNSLFRQYSSGPIIAYTTDNGVDSDNVIYTSWQNDMAAVSLAFYEEQIDPIHLILTGNPNLSL